MKALSLWQPWASAIADGEKRIETRHWSTYYRGPLLIHAAKQGPKSQVADWIDDLMLDLDVDLIPFGALVAVSKLARCCRAEDLDVSEREDQLGDFSEGRFGWMLTDVRAFKEPIPFKGMQGIFDVPEDVVADALKAVGWEASA
jgi:hypothetical protein